MSTSLLQATGRCRGAGPRLSVAQHVFGKARRNGRSLARRLDTALANGESVASWLNRNRNVRDAINWQHAGVVPLFWTRTNYKDWPTADKRLLQRLVTQYSNCRHQSLTDPPVNQATVGDQELPKQVYSFTDAKAWYLVFVAQTLVVEMGRWVPWSITHYSGDELSYLLDSTRLFEWRFGNVYEMIFEEHGPCAPARPRRTWEFLVDNDLIGANRLETIGRVLDWCRWNMRHFYGDTHASGKYWGDSMVAHWGYRGFPPARRVMEGTVRTGTTEKVHYTGGCHGTVAFLRAVLRVVNIPVRYLRRCHHALPHFLPVNRYLSHGDDPYNQKVKREDLPIEDLLIDQTLFGQWFGPGADHCTNVGKGVDEAVKNLP